MSKTQLQLQTQPQKENIAEKNLNRLLKKISGSPPEISKHINSTFNDISQEDMSIFKYNGGYKNSYSSASIEDIEIIDKMLKEYSSMGKENFTFMDIGGGMHGCADSISEYINNNKHLYPNIKQVEIVSLSGNDGLNESYQEGICRVSKLSKFKVEELDRWINVTDDFMEALSEIDKVHKLAEDMQGTLRQISNKIIKSSPLIADKLISQDLDDIYLEDISSNKESNLDIENKNLSDQREIFEELNERYSELCNEFEEFYGQDESIKFVYDANLPKDKNKKLFIEEVDNLIDEINEKDISTQQNLKASTELKLLNDIKEMNLPKKYDYIASSKCLMHLTDPVKTFRDAYNMLTPEKGIMKTDMFDFNILSKNQEKLSTQSNKGKEGYNTSIMELLHNTNTPHLSTTGYKSDGIIVHRPDDKELDLNYKNINLKKIDIESIYSEAIIEIDVRDNEKWLNRDIIHDKLYFRDSGYEAEDYPIIGRAVENRGNPNIDDSDYFFKSVENALLINKLHRNGINLPGIKNETYQNIEYLIKDEFPKDVATENYPYKELLLQQQFFNDIKNIDNLDNFKKLIDSEKDRVNIHALNLVTKEKSLEKFQLIFDVILERYDDEDKKQLATGGALISAINAKSEEIENYIKKQHLQDIENPNLLKSVIESYVKNEETEKALECIKNNEHLAQTLYDDLVLNETKTTIPNLITKVTGKILSDSLIEKYLDQNKQLTELIDNETIKKEDFLSIDNLDTLKTLTKSQIVQAYKNKSFTPKDLIQINDPVKIKLLTNRKTISLLKKKVPFKEIAKLETNKLDLLLENNLINSKANFNKYKNKELSVIKIEVIKNLKNTKKDLKKQLKDLEHDDPEAKNTRSKLELLDKKINEYTNQLPQQKKVKTLKEKISNEDFEQLKNVKNSISKSQQNLIKSNESNQKNTKTLRKNLHKHSSSRG